MSELINSTVPSTNSKYILVAWLQKSTDAFLFYFKRKRFLPAKSLFFCHISPTHLFVSSQCTSTSAKNTLWASQNKPVCTSSVTLNRFSKATNFCLMLGCCRGRKQEKCGTTWEDGRGIDKRKMIAAQSYFSTSVTQNKAVKWWRKK